MTQLDYATPNPQSAPSFRDVVRTCLIAIPCMLAGFTAASLLGVNLAFWGATVYLGHSPRITNTPPAAVPYKVMALGLVALPAAIAFPAMLGMLMLRHPRFRGRLVLQLILPTVLFAVVLAIHAVDPFGARAWLFGE